MYSSVTQLAHVDLVSRDTSKQREGQAIVHGT
jgi:hypothetical protein